MILSNESEKTNSSPLRIFGHRGAMGEAPENTIAGFEYAYTKAQVRNFELDIRLTKDEELAVFHDETVDRTTNGKGCVWNYTLAELKLLNACAFFPWFKHAYIPTLEEILSRFGDRVENFQIEIKPDEEKRMEIVVKKLLELLDTYKIKQKVTITSFSPYALTALQTLAPRTRRGFISYHFTLETIHLAEKLGCENACIPLKVGNQAMVWKAKERGMSVTGWLGNTQQDIDTLLDWGVDEVTSNYPSFAIPYIRWKVRNA